MARALARVGAVVLSYNRRELTVACLRSLATVPDVRVLLVDNASADGTVEAVRKGLPGVEVLALPENRGYGGGMNAGVERLLAEGAEYVLLLNNDTLFPDPGFAQKLAAALDADARAAVAGPRVVSLETGRVLFDGPTRDRYGTMPVNPAAMMWRAAWIREHGLFDPAFFVYFEDRDLFRRMEATGWRAVHVDEAVVAHSERSPSSGGHLSAVKLHHWNRSFVVYARKHLGRGEALRAFAADRLRILPWQTKEMLKARDWRALRMYWSGYREGWKAARKVRA